MPVTRPDDVLTTAEVCRLLKITRPTLYHWIEEGKLKPWKKLGDGSTFLFLREFLTGKPLKRYSRSKETAGVGGRDESDPLSPAAPPSPGSADRTGSKIVLLSRDAALVRQARTDLESQGYTISAAGSLHDLKALLKEAETPEIIIADLDLARPSLSCGRELTPRSRGGDARARAPGPGPAWKFFEEIKKLAAKTSLPSPACILLSGPGAAPLDAAKALKNGAWDFLKKPVASSVFVARVRLSLRRRFWTELDSAPGERVFTSRDGNIRLDSANRILRITDPAKNDSDLPLTRKEAELLCLFLKRPGITLSKPMLLELIWGYTVNIRTRTIDCHIKNLRQKLGPYGKRIETRYSFGYCFH